MLFDIRLLAKRTRPAPVKYTQCWAVVLTEGDNNDIINPCYAINPIVVNINVKDTTTAR